MADQNKPDFVKWALAYAALGWYIFPLATKDDVKEPHGMLGKPGGHNEASIDPERIKSWWQRSPTSGIGLNLAKSGLIAVDIDPRNGGNETIARVEKARGALPSAVVSMTGGGGEHRLFNAPPGLKGAPGRIGPPKGGVDLKYNGYIVLPPSPWATRDADRVWQPPSGPGYRWRKSYEPFNGTAADYLIPIPEWVLTSGSESAARTGTIDPDDVFKSDTPKCGLSLEEMRETLDLIPNSGDQELDYDDWFNIICGIYHETDGSADGKDLAKEFSERSMRHVAEDFEKKWPSANIEGKDRAPVTFRFAIKLASERKRVVEKQTADDLETSLKSAQDVPGLLVVAGEIKRVELNPLFRTILIGELQNRYKILTGKALAIADARRLTRYENPDFEEPPEWLEGWVFCGQQDEFYKAGTRQTLSPSAFNHMFNHHMITRQEKKEGKASPEVTAADAALNRFNIPKVYGHMYYPGQPEEFVFQGANYINTYTDKSQPEVPETLTPADRRAIDIVKAHFSLLAPHQNECDLVLSYLAHMVQTMQRPNWAICFQSAEGVGKSFLVELMGAILGSENVQPIFASKLMDRASFNEWAVGSIISVVDEVKQNSENRFVVLDKLQQVITNDTISLHEKGKGIRAVRNTAAYILLTNHRDALPVHLGDSRYFMVSSRLQTRAQVEAFERENPDYFADLFRAVNEHAGALRKFFLEYKLCAAFDPRRRAPKSREHAHAVAINTSETQLALEDALAESTDPWLKPGLLNTQRLSDAMTESTGLIPQTRQVDRLLTSAGFSYLGRFKMHGSMQRFWSRSPEDFPEDTPGRAAAIRARDATGL